MKTGLLLLAFVTALFGSASAQAPIPPRYDGYAVGNTSAPIVLEAFFDLMCPDCKAAWPTVKKVLQHYGPNQVYFIVHTFPLPYHHNAFIAAQGMKTVKESFPGSDPYDWMEAVFADQDAFGNPATANQSMNEVNQAFAQLASSSMGLDSSKFLAGLNDADVNWDTRVSWKYTCSRGVSGTPTFFLNGVLSQAASNWTVQQWEQLIDSLLAGNDGRA